MIDTSKIRPGDTGTIRVRFESSVIKLEEDEILVCVGGHSIYVPASAIASHTPAPWVPEKGDVVRWNDAREWEILGLAYGRAWIKSKDAFNTPYITALTLIRKGAA